MTTTVTRDERTEAVENSSFRVAYLVVSFGLLLSVMYRSYVLGQSSWDLLAIVVIGGLAATAYQGRQGILTRRWVLTVLAAAIVAGVVATVVAVTLTR